eukprot:1139529-Pelagomonas_calceolata.AAC.1
MSRLAVNRFDWRPSFSCNLSFQLPLLVVGWPLQLHNLSLIFTVKSLAGHKQLTNYNLKVELKASLFVGKTYFGCGGAFGTDLGATDVTQCYPSEDKTQGYTRRIRTTIQIQGDRNFIFAKS